MRLERLDLPLPAPPGALWGATETTLLDVRTRQALIKLLGRAIDLVGEAEARALAPRLIAYLAGSSDELSRARPAGARTQHGWHHN